MFIEAFQLAYKYHNGQLRKQSCVPYIVHPYRVSCCFQDDFKKTIAILHDIVEDTDMTLEELQKHFPPYVVCRIDYLTRREGEKHFDYIKRGKNDEVATEIKIADIMDNLSDTICVVEKSMADRYNKSLKILLK